MVAKRAVWLLTDFGHDYAVGRLKGAIKRKAPLVDVFDLDHSVPPQKTLAGAWRLLASIPSLPNDSVIVAVVDPHVGSERKGVVVELETGHILVGPADNGLLSAAVQAYGAKRIHFLENTSLFNGSEALILPNHATTGDLFSSVTVDIGHRSALGYETFHGLSIFAPVGAHIANGVPLNEVGPEAAANAIARLSLPLAATTTQLTGALVDIDTFGTLRTNIPFALLDRIGARTGHMVRFRLEAVARNCPVFNKEIAVGHIFDDVERTRWIALPGSVGGTIDIAVSHGNAARQLKDIGGCDPTVFLDVEKKGGVLRPVNGITIELERMPLHAVA